LLCKRFYSHTTAMGKRGSSAANATIGTAKKAKMNTEAADSDAPTVGNWCHTKFLDQDLQKIAKSSILKDDPAEVRISGPEVIPRPPADSGYFSLHSSSTGSLSLRMNSSAVFFLTTGFRSII
jgi:hypothetical protein